MDLVQTFTLRCIPDPFRYTEGEIKTLAWNEGLRVIDVLLNEGIPIAVPPDVWISGNKASLHSTIEPNQFVLVAIKPGDPVTVGTIIAVVKAIAVWVTTNWAGILIAAGGLLVNFLLKPSMPKMHSGESPTRYSWTPGNTQQPGIAIPKVYGEIDVFGNLVNTHIDNKDKNQYLCCINKLCMGPIKRLYDFRINGQEAHQYEEVEIEVRLGYVDQDPYTLVPATKVYYPENVVITQGINHIYTTDVGDNDFNRINVEMCYKEGLWASGSEGLVWWEVQSTIEYRKHGMSPEDPWTPLTEIATSSYTIVEITEARWSLGKYQVLPQYPLTELWVEYTVGTTNIDDHKEGDQSQGYTWRWLEIGSVIATGAAVETSILTVHIRSTSPVYRTYRIKVPSAGTYDIRINRISEDTPENGKYGSKLSFMGVKLVHNDEFEYPRQAGYAIKARATDQLSSSMEICCTCKGSIVRIPGASYHEGAADVATDGFTNVVTTTNNAFTNVISGDEIVARNEKLFVLRKINSNTVVVHKKVNWSGGYSFKYRNWNFSWSECHAWCAVDVITQPVICGEGTTEKPYTVNRFDGHDPSFVDYDAYKSWADWSENNVSNGDGGFEKRFTFNGVFDQSAPMWDNLVKLCRSGRAVPTWNGNVISVCVDKPETPSGFYGMGNIYVTDTLFQETFLSTEERSTKIESSYLNRDTDYGQDVMTVYRPNFLTHSGYKSQVDAFGLVKPSEVWRYLMNALMSNIYAVRTFGFGVDIEALNNSIGDVVYLSHEIPMWNQSGRILAAGPQTVTLRDNEAVTIIPDTTYRLLVKLDSDDLVWKTVTNPPDTNITVLTLDSPFATVPVKDDNYLFGIASEVDRLVRITDIKRKGNHKCELIVSEYREEVWQYENDTPAMSSRLRERLERMQPKNVDYDILHIVTGPEGIRHWMIQLTFTPTVLSRFDHYEVWYRTSRATGHKYKDNADWMYVGNTETSPFSIIDVERETVYQVVFLPVTKNNYKLPIEFAVKHKVVVKRGVTDYPWPTITNLRMLPGSTDTFHHTTAPFVWDDLSRASAGTTTPSAPFNHYQFQILSLTDEVKGTYITRSPRFDYTLQDNTDDFDGTPAASFKGRVRIMDTYGNFSAWTTITVTNPPPDMSEYSPVTTRSSGVVEIKWDTWDGETSDMKWYRILASTSPTPTIQNSEYKRVVSKGTNSVRIPLAPVVATTYYFQVWPYDEFQLGEKSRIVHRIIPAASSFASMLGEETELSTDESPNPRVVISGSAISVYKDATNTGPIIDSGGVKIKTPASFAAVDSFKFVTGSQIDASFAAYKTGLITVARLLADGGDTNGALFYLTGLARAAGKIGGLVLTGEDENGSFYISVTGSGITTNYGGLVTNLNAEKLGSQYASFYRNISNMNAGTLPAARFDDTSHGTKSAFLHSDQGYMIPIAAMKFTPDVSGTYYFAANPTTEPQTSATTIVRGSIPGPGLLMRARINWYAEGIVGSSQSIGMSVVIGDDEYSVDTIGDTERNKYFVNNTMEVAVLTGTKYVCKLTCPTWTVKPTDVWMNGFLFVTT